MIKHELVTIASIVLSTVAQYETILRYVDILSLSALFHPRMQKMVRLDRSPLLLYTPDPGCLFVCMQHLPLNIRSLVVHEARYHDQTTGEPEEIKRRSICSSRVLQTFHELSDVMEPRGGKSTFSGVKNISSSWHIVVRRWALRLIPGCGPESKYLQNGIIIMQIDPGAHKTILGDDTPLKRNILWWFYDNFVQSGIVGDTI